MEVNKNQTPENPEVNPLREIARLTNLYLGDGCCENHQSTTLQLLHAELAKFEDDSFTTLKARPQDTPASSPESNS